MTWRPGAGSLGGTGRHSHVAWYAHTVKWVPGYYRTHLALGQDLDLLVIRHLQAG